MARSPDKPRYAVIAKEVAGAIGRGQFPVGTLLPSETELRAQYDVSHHTVREAMRVLQDLRLVAPERGRGTRVVARSAASRYVHTLEAIPDLGEVARETRIKVLRRTRIRRDAAEGTLPAGSDAWYLIEAVRSTPSHPLVWKQVYIDARYAKAALEGRHQQHADLPAGRTALRREARHGAPGGRRHPDHARGRRDPRGRQRFARPLGRAPVRRRERPGVRGDQEHLSGGPVPLQQRAPPRPPRVTIPDDRTYPDWFMVVDCR